MADLNNGAIYFGLKPARPQPIYVTKKISYGLFLANSINYFTNIYISFIDKVFLTDTSFVGIPHVLP